MNNQQRHLDQPRMPKQRRGIALMLVMVAILVTGAMAVAYFGSRDNSIAISRNVEASTRARVVAELPFTPTSIIAGLGISSLKADVDSLDSDPVPGPPPIPGDKFDEEVIGPYFHIGVLLHMGDHAHLGLDYRAVDYGDDLNPIHYPRRLTEQMETLTIMAGVNW